MGFGKTGIPGINGITVPLLSLFFDPKQSTGTMLPMLIVGDLFAIAFYRENVDWKAIARLLPGLVAGVLLGTVVGGYIDADGFRRLLGIIVLVSVALMVHREVSGAKPVALGKAIQGATGVAAGFTSMIGNASGAVMALYLLSMGYDKKNYMGTNAVLFLVVNLLKLPLQVVVWRAISFETLKTTLFVAPFIVVGAVIGLKYFKKAKDASFRWAIILVTFLSAVLLLIR